MKDIHVVANFSTAGSLRWAIRQHLLTGEVICPMDAPEIGPFNDGVARSKFWINLGYPGITSTEIYQLEKHDIFEPWKLLRKRLSQSLETRLVVWIGGCGSDYVFLRMACWWMEGIAVSLVQVKVPPVNGEYSTAVNPPDILASMIVNAVETGETERHQLAAEYEEIAERPELLRECDENGKLLFHDLSIHDDLLIACCKYEWQNAARVVGEAMGRSNGRNPLGDMFLASRLEHLINNNKILANGPRISLRSFSVRLEGSE